MSDLVGELISELVPLLGRGTANGVLNIWGLSLLNSDVTWYLVGGFCGLILVPSSFLLQSILYREPSCPKDLFALVTFAMSGLAAVQGVCSERFTNLIFFDLGLLFVPGLLSSIYQVYKLADSRDMTLGRLFRGWFKSVAILSIGLLPATAAQVLAFRYVN